MRKRKIIIIIAVVLLLISLSIGGYIYRDYINVYLVNREIDVDGVKLLMSGDDAGKIFNEKYDPKLTSAKYIYHTLGRQSLIVDVIKIGKYKHKVISIYTDEDDDIILGVKEGDKLEHAAAELKKRRFTVEAFDKNTTSLEASRGNILVHLHGGQSADGGVIYAISIFIHPDMSK